MYPQALLLRNTALQVVHGCCRQDSKMDACLISSCCLKPAVYTEHSTTAGTLARTISVAITFLHRTVPMCKRVDLPTRLHTGKSASMCKSAGMPVHAGGCANGILALDATFNEINNN